MRIRREKGLIRFFRSPHGEVAYIVTKIRGLQAEIEFPSDWHENRRGWVRLGFVLFTIAFSFPWKWVSRDEGQCSGHTYGFNFFQGSLHLHWGKQKGTSDDPFAVLRMPWQWRSKSVEVLPDKVISPYRYQLASGELQVRTATAVSTKSTYVRPWIPWRKYDYHISVSFDAEVGEGSGSWKGGVLACGYERYPGESAVSALMRMERDRKFP